MNELPAGLQVLKDQARTVRADQNAEREAEKESIWQSLLAAAKESLGPLWEFVTDKNRPHHFPASACTWRHEFCVKLPGHREIVAIFEGMDNRAPKWRRSYYHGANASDVHGERSLWMVGQRQRHDGQIRMPFHYHTLGAALVAAEGE